jgi:exodeoxyribonuclease VII small subunit
LFFVVDAEVFMADNADKEISFEEALAGLEACAKRISSPDVSIEDAIGAYEEGAAYYGKCERILNDARGRVEVIDANGDGEAKDIKDSNYSNDAGKER